MVEILRSEPDAIGLTTALGWYITKHAAGVWSARPPERGFRLVDPASTQARVDALPRRESTGPFAGDVVVEATSVAFDRDGSPVSALLTGLTSDGRRAIARSADAGVVRSFTTEPWEGRTVRLAPTDGVNEVVR
jgi:acetyl-CoA C-acetyltransferase